MSELIGKKVKVVNTNGFQNDDNYELYLYLGQTGIINDYKTTIHRFTIEFDDELMENIDFDNDKLLFAIDNVEFIDENSINKETISIFNSNNNVKNSNKDIKLQNIIKQMLNVIGNYEGSKLSLHIWPFSEICVYIYETEISIVINVKEKYAYIDTDTMDNHLTASMLDELCQIVKIIDDNIDVFMECVK